MAASDNQWLAEIKVNLWQIAAATVKTISLAWTVGMHYLLHLYVLPMAVPVNWRPRLLPVLEAAFFGGFAVIYAQQVFDMVVIFVPWLRHKKQQQTTVGADV